MKMNDACADFFCNIEYDDSGKLFESEYKKETGRKIQPFNYPGSIVNKGDENDNVNLLKKIFKIYGYCFNVCRTLSDLIYCMDELLKDKEELDECLKNRKFIYNGKVYNTESERIYKGYCEDLFPKNIVYNGKTYRPCSIFDNSDDDTKDYADMDYAEVLKSNKKVSFYLPASDTITEWEDLYDNLKYNLYLKFQNNRRGGHIYKYYPIKVRKSDNWRDNVTGKLKQYFRLIDDQVMDIPLYYIERYYLCNRIQQLMIPYGFNRNNPTCNLHLDLNSGRAAIQEDLYNTNELNICEKLFPYLIPDNDSSYYSEIDDDFWK